MNVINAVIIYFLKSPVECMCHTCKVGICDFTFTSFNQVQVAFGRFLRACASECVVIEKVKKGSQLQRFLFSLLSPHIRGAHSRTYEPVRIILLFVHCVHTRRPAPVRIFATWTYYTRAQRINTCKYLLIVLSATSHACV